MSFYIDFTPCDVRKGKLFKAESWMKGLCSQMLWELLIPHCLSLNQTDLQYLVRWHLIWRKCGSRLWGDSSCSGVRSGQRLSYAAWRNFNLTFIWIYWNPFSSRGPRCFVLMQSKLRTNAWFHFLLSALYICLLQLPTQVLRLVCFCFVLSFALSVSS